MKGSDKVIEHLNDLLAGELTAIDQYMIHGYMYEDWGLYKLYEVAIHEEKEERDHAAALIQRILFLEGTPNLGKRIELNVGTDVPSMLKNDLEVEYAVVKHLREVIEYCESVRDFVTRELLVKMLDDTESDHTYYLEQQLGLIEKMGLENYLQSQTGKKPADAA